MMPETNIALLYPDWAEELNNSLLRNSALCIALFSAEKELLFANEAMKKLFIEPEAWRNLLNPDFESLARLNAAASLVYSGFLTLGNLTAINTSIMADVYRKAGRILIVGGVDAAQLVENNTVLHELNHDISNLQRQLMKEKRTLEVTLKELGEAHASLKELNQTKDKFFSVIAHDLRNPFFVLLGYSDMLLQDAAKNTPDQIMEYAQSIHTTSERTYTMLENLLEWAKVQTGQLVPRPEELSIMDVVESVKEICLQQADAKQIGLLTEIQHDEMVRADKEMLHFVIRNLLVNAIKFTQSGGTITLRVAQQVGETLFVVADTGIGIEDPHLHSLFNIDSTLSKSGTAGEKGSGLGLILCKEFVEKHGGKIWVESQVGKGSSFCFLIPR